MIYKHDYQRIAFDTDRMMIATIIATTGLLVFISNGKKNIVLNVYKRKLTKVKSTFIFMSVSLSVKKKSGRPGTKCVKQTLNICLL